MIDKFIESLTTYYVLDWLAFLLGMAGTYLLTNKDRLGFLLCCVAGVCAFAVAIISSQFGFVVYNLLLISLNFRGFVIWNRTPARLEKSDARSCPMND